MSWTTILLLAGGAYLFKSIGFLVLGPLSLRGRSPDAGPADGRAKSASHSGGPALRLGQLLPAALLAALVVSQTVTSGDSLVLDARLAGVTAGAVTVWRGGPFWLVLLVAAATTAGLRLLT